jgi:hypothetical protein
MDANEIRRHCDNAVADALVRIKDALNGGDALGGAVLSRTEVADITQALRDLVESLVEPVEG